MLTLAQKFEILKSQWRAETQFQSSIVMIIANNNYQDIIRLGRHALPFILRELSIQPNHWFYALQEITCFNPVKTEDRGDVEKMANAWLKWAQDHNINF